MPGSPRNGTSTASVAQLSENRRRLGDRCREAEGGLTAARCCVVQGGSCGFGMRGQKSRSGSGTRPGFEGGQTSLYRRIPKLRGIAGGTCPLRPHAFFRMSAVAVIRGLSLWLPHPEAAPTCSMVSEARRNWLRCHLQTAPGTLLPCNSPVAPATSCGLVRS